MLLDAGFIMGMVRFVMSMACLRQIDRAGQRFGRVQLRLSDKALVPFSTRGFHTHYVVIPSQMLAEVLKPIFFLNPVYHA